MDEDRDAIDRVRSDLAALGTDAGPAPEIPPHVTARVDAALRAAADARPSASHAARGPLVRRRTITMVGVIAALIGIGVGTAMLLRPTAPVTDAPGPTAAHVTRQANGFPVPDSVLRELPHRTPDFGPLEDPQRRAACLTALGYGADVQVLGATPVPAGVVLLLPGTRPGSMDAVAVGSACTALDQQVLGSTTVAVATTPDHP